MLRPDRFGPATDSRVRLAFLARAAYGSAFSNHASAYGLSL
jgi:hypothetical protein